MTRNGIEYDLAKSPYTTTNWPTGIKFFFSSQKYMDKFLRMTTEECQIMNYTFKKKYLISFNTTELALITLYRKIEKRGFLIEVDGAQFKQPPYMEVRVQNHGY